LTKLQLLSTAAISKEFVPGTNSLPKFQNTPVRASGGTKRGCSYSYLCKESNVQIHLKRKSVLKSTKLANTPSVNQLVRLWEKRYTPELSPLIQDPSSYASLVEAVVPEGRALTAAKLRERLLRNNCQMAAIQTKALYAYLPNVLELNEARKITEYAFQVYQKLLEIYQQQSPIVASRTERLLAVVDNPESVSLPSWRMPPIEQLATAIEPVLLEFQEQHKASKDWRTLGFITTQLNFSNKLVLEALTPIEKALLNPYLKFVEEQVALPWQRVCAAAVKHELGSPALSLVMQMLPDSQEIAETTYRRFTQLLPNHHSRRGGLSNPGVTHSCLRDLNMFQAYLWLCVLEESMAAVEQELVGLCVMVMQSVEVKWEMIEQWTKVLTDEIMRRLNPEQKSLLLPYTQKIHQAFLEKRVQLGANPLPALSQLLDAG
jgi:hypothetical protein